MRNLTEIHSQIAADPATRCSRNSVIFTTAIDLEIKCSVGSTHQRKDIVLHHCGQFCQLPRIVIPYFLIMSIPFAGQIFRPSSKCFSDAFLWGKK